MLGGRKEEGRGEEQKGKEKKREEGREGGVVGDEMGYGNCRLRMIIEMGGRNLVNTGCFGCGVG